MFWAVAGRTQAAEGKLATSFFAAEIGLDPISAFAKNSGALEPKRTIGLVWRKTSGRRNLLDKIAHLIEQLKNNT
ncbi:MAG: hypothetical protein FJ190_04675 [Gammaproteobacteria bacterium]|nr:hypothetical protein [Gammaproteobacteria bacterium]